MTAQAVTVNCECGWTSGVTYHDCVIPPMRRPMGTVMKNEYTTIVDITRPTIVYHGDNLELAIRAWNGETHWRNRPINGGVQVKVTDDDGVIVRDEWLVQIKDNGVCLLSPNLNLQVNMT